MAKTSGRTSVTVRNVIYFAITLCLSYVSLKRLANTANVFINDVFFMFIYDQNVGKFLKKRQYSLRFNTISTIVRLL